MIVCDKHVFTQETMQTPGEFRITFYCTKEGCWRSKSFLEEYPKLASEIQRVCIKQVHRLDPETLGCYDCGMPRKFRHLIGNEGIPTKDMYADMPLIFTLPKDTDREIWGEFLEMYKSFLKDKLDIELKDGSQLPGTEHWDIGWSVP